MSKDYMSIYAYTNLEDEDIREGFVCLIGLINLLHFL
ncbi:hypothetical protein CLIT_2c00030 [Peptoclostridium litorale DSM 5388]|uniref:Uncharacterized protein n=1 Tax=Peptoclostridium litorale DSM 5388 TaxID=1121324 RepID=A0A069RQE7_PEPLI|nr:hypothetical protein CLIT_2c00030 [Peptoclostridium litorale DSM 5388]